MTDCIAEWKILIFNIQIYLSVGIKPVICNAMRTEEISEESIPHIKSSKVNSIAGNHHHYINFLFH